LDYFDWLWRRAHDELVPNPFCPFDDDEGPEPPAGFGVRPRPSKPKGPTGGPGDARSEPEFDDSHPTVMQPVEPKPIITDPRRSRALVIGVEHYNDSGRDDVPVRDLDALGRIRNLIAPSFQDGADLLVNPSRDSVWNALT